MPGCPDADSTVPVDAWALATSVGPLALLTLVQPHRSASVRRAEPAAHQPGERVGPSFVGLRSLRQRHDESFVVVLGGDRPRATGRGRHILGVSVGADTLHRLGGERPFGGVERVEQRRPILVHHRGRGGRSRRRSRGRPHPCGSARPPAHLQVLRRLLARLDLHLEGLGGLTRDGLACMQCRSGSHRSRSSKRMRRPTSIDLTTGPRRASRVSREFSRVRRGQATG